MPHRDVVEQIQQFNQGRNPDLLKLKYQAMAQNAFAFLRGTCHLFYQDLASACGSQSTFQTAPPVWICGDLHLQNFGTFKGDDRLVYFDVNDFDEAVLAPCTWEIVRFLTSALVGAHTFGASDAEAEQLCTCFLEVYTAALRAGKSRTVHGTVAVGMVKELLESLKARSRRDFLDQRTDLKSKQRQLKLIANKVTAVSPQERRTITASIDDWATHQPNSDFYKVLDVAHRIAGTGSLGVDRYVLLVEGDGSPHQNYLLDLKAVQPSSLQPYIHLPQPAWETEAARVTAIQDRFQESPPALLNALVQEQQSFVLRELQPTADRVNLEAGNGKIKRLKRVITTMAQVTAWGQLRSSGRQGSAIADDLIAFADHSAQWHSALLNYAQVYAAQVEEDYQVFREALQTKL